MVRGFVTKTPALARLRLPSFRGTGRGGRRFRARAFLRRARRGLGRSWGLGCGSRWRGGPGRVGDGVVPFRVDRAQASRRKCVTGAVREAFEALGLRQQIPRRLAFAFVRSKEAGVLLQHHVGERGEQRDVARVRGAAQSDVPALELRRAEHVDEEFALVGAALGDQICEGVVLVHEEAAFALNGELHKPVLPAHEAFGLRGT